MKSKKIKTGAIILAAGRSSRFKGHKLKTLLPSGLSLLEVILLSAKSWNISDLMVVLGPDTEDLADLVSLNGFKSILNNRPDLGMGHSLKTGLKALLTDSFQKKINKNRVDCIIFTPADIPMIRPNTVNTLIKKYWLNKSQNEDNLSLNNSLSSDKIRDLIIPCYNNKKGHPPLIGQAHFNEILNLPDTKGPNSIAHENPNSLELLSVDDPGILRDIDTIDDYEAMSHKIEVYIKTWLTL